MIYKKYYTVKEWKKFDKVAERENGIDITTQEILLKRYEIILTDYKTKHGLIEKDYYFDLNGIEKADQISHVKEKLFSVLDKFNAKNINAGIDKFNKGMDQFSKVVASSSGNNTKSTKSKPRKMGISQKDYDKLFKSPKKSKSISFWDEDRKTRKRRNKRKPAVQKGPDYSFLTGESKKRVKFF